MKYLLLAASAFVLVPFASATDIDVGYSDSFAERLEDDYGMREGVYLTGVIQKDIEREFEKRGIEASRVDVTILKATPNRPTFEQLGDRVTLDFGRSFGIGGMKLSATAYDADGNEIGAYEYGWFEDYIHHVVGYATWTDANRASDRFARKFARELAG